MKCHYETLEISRNADDEAIKKAYRKLALKWHPDKNPENLEECTKYFSVIQQAYDVLSDPHERAWYDRHREEILMGGLDENYKDNTLDLASYFDSNCYEGYDDDSEGFYSVYRQVFDILANEDYEFAEDSEIKYPSFGDSRSDYDDKYDIRSAENAKILKAMKKENNKVREAAKKERNEEIRRLVDFIRKRDRRIKKHRKFLEERRLEQERKTEENRLERIKQNLLQIGEHKESEESRLGHLEDLKEIEECLEAEFGRADDDDNSENAEDFSSLYCVACKKVFKSQRVLSNHEKTKKHIEIVNELRKHMQEEDAILLEESLHQQTNVEVAEQDSRNKSSSRKSKKQRKRTKKTFDLDNSSESGSEICQEAEGNVESTIRVVNEEENMANINTVDNEANIFLNATDEGKKNSQKEKKSKAKQKDGFADYGANDNVPRTGVCERCGESFDSRTKLFGHLKESGHATIKPAVTLPKSRAKRKGKQ